MKRLLLAAAVALFATISHAAEMPRLLIGQWCQTTDSEDFIKAKIACKATRPVVYTIHNVGFWITLAGVKGRIMCVPIKVEDWAHGWMVTADCGLDDLSSEINRLGFTFEFEQSREKMVLSRWKP